MAKSKYYGTSGSSVSDMQKQLNAQGASLSVDGVWGKKTEAAYARYKSKLTSTSTMSTGKTQSATYKQAVSKYTPKYNANVQAANTQYSQTVASLNNLKAQYNANYKTSVSEAKAQSESSLKQGLQTISDNMLKRGMGRSSQYIGDVTNYQSQSNSELNSKLNKYASDRTASLNSIAEKAAAAKNTLNTTKTRLKADLSYNISNEKAKLDKEKRNYNIQLAKLKIQQEKWAKQKRK